MTVPISRYRNAKTAVAHTLMIGAALLGIACRPAASQEAPPAATAQAPAQDRLVTIGGAVTETVFALGLGSQVVGVDTSSVFPPAAAQLPKVGYQRTIAAEGVLSLRPTRVVVSEEAGPPHALAQLRNAGLAVDVIAGKQSIAGAKEKIRAIANLLQVPERGAQLAAKLDADFAHAQSIAAWPGSRPRVLFLYARGAGTAMVGGASTSAAAMIELAGAANAAAALEGFKPYSAEALVAALPDIILLTERGMASLGGAEAVRQLPGLASLPGERMPRVVALDDLMLLGFGPRTGQAVAELHAKLAEQAKP